MRQTTWLIALGMERCGSCASPAVMPTSSTPPKLNSTTTTAITSPDSPCGRKPPCAHRLAMPVASPPLPQPNSTMASPKAIMAMMATTLMMANQNSNSP